MAAALGLAVRAGVVRGVVIEGPPAAAAVVYEGLEELTCESSLTPHVDFRCASADELRRQTARSERDITAAATRAVDALMAPFAAGRVSVIAVVVPRCPQVAELQRRVARRTYAECADAHLVAAALVRASASAGAPVATLSAVEALRGAEHLFGLDRQALGELAGRGPVTERPGFDYHHRLPLLAAKVALASWAGRADQAVAGSWRISSARSRGTGEPPGSAYDQT